MSKIKGVNELRSSFLKFFETKDHLAHKSYSLVPHNDKSLLLINAGMAPLKPYFTGIEVPPKTRMCTCQKCVRTGDIDNVGKTARHLTFFEMLGNFSFGDYFKEESLKWSWEFLTEVVGLEADRLYPSIYFEDDEAYDIWTQKIGVPGEKITRFYRDEDGKCDNFWEHGAGPCGPCSEIYYDRGEKYGCGKPDCKVGCECDRYMEVWNNVFTQYDGDGNGNYSLLEQKNIDTGMGLERLAVVAQNVDSVFDIDTMKAIRDEVCAVSGKKYQVNEKDDVSIRVITDHIRSSTFLISDGVMPSNEGRGYVLRRLIRRAARHGKLLGIEGEFLSELCKVVIGQSKDGYPELEEKKDFIINVFEQEEKKFAKTINQGLSILSGMMEDLKKENKTVLSGEDAFKLHDTYGFPLDLTVEIANEQGYSVDVEGFNKAMKEQKDMARASRKTTNYMGADATVYEELDESLTTEFVGYDRLKEESSIGALVKVEDDEAVLSEALTDGEEGSIVTAKTPFYATMGGQVGDKGRIVGEDGVFVVEETIKVTGNRYAHVGHMESGMLKKGEKVSLEVCEKNRNRTCRNHSATHLLQSALREVLGSHVEQAGSYQDSERTRFDFAHFKAMSGDEIHKVEELVNNKIMEGIGVDTAVMSVEDAKKTGAMALFGEKYGDKVRVVSMGDFSKEFCGGTHVKNTSDIGSFKIVSEAGVAAGTRRIEALTGDNVLKYYAHLEEEMNKVAAALKTTPANVLERVEGLMKETKELHSENEALKSKAAKEAMGDVTDNVEEVKGVKFLAVNVPNVDMNNLRELGDNLKEKLGDGVILLASDFEGKVNLVAMATDGAMKKGAHAGMLIKNVAALVGGGGGGRPNMAQAGGKNPAGIKDALTKAKEVLEGQIK
ncbi:MAG: alanine--tRNA ligase [Lachnospiraceae bacterium]|nr:alanine--tRNA ligase [Lachnospiraceae bacterium]